MWLVISWTLVALAAVYLYLRQVYSRFSRHGVRGPHPLPFFGTMMGISFKREHFAEYLQRMYNSYPKDRFVGSYEFFTPMAVIRDLELIKKITIKDFDHFVDHRTIVDETIDPYFGKSLISMKGQKWRDMRATLSPAFTSSKIRAMIPFMMDVGDQMVNGLKRKIKDSESGYIDVDIKDLASRYANDVIATCAFGIKVDSIADENNEFHKMGKSIFNIGFWSMLKIFAYLSIPGLMKKLKLSLLAEDAKLFLKELVLGTMKDREEKHIVRPDMIHLLMEARKGKLTHDVHDNKDSDTGFAAVEEYSVGKKQVTRVWDDMDMLGQVMIFFVAGFETVSTVMTFLLLELAINPDIQERLYKEIKGNDKKNGGKFDYSSIQSMTYLDMVVSEVLRLWSPVVGTDRYCVKDYNLGKANDDAEDYIVRKGEVVLLPVWALHRDPRYFPAPARFDPERFHPDRVHNIQPLTYLTGTSQLYRFALCEVKVMVYQLLLNMEVSLGKKLQVPLQLSSEPFNVNVKGGSWLQIRAR